MFTLNLQSREPIYEQLYKNVVKLISLGILKPDDKLPPMRILAAEQGINPNTVSKAYQKLEKEGVIYSVVGKGSFISEDVSVIDHKKDLIIQELKQLLKRAEEIGITFKELDEIIAQNYKEGVR